MMERQCCPRRQALLERSVAVVVSNRVHQRRHSRHQWRSAECSVISCRSTSRAKHFLIGHGASCAAHHLVLAGNAPSSRLRYCTHVAGPSLPHLSLHVLSRSRPPASPISACSMRQFDMNLHTSSAIFSTLLQSSVYHKQKVTCVYLQYQQSKTGNQLDTSCLSSLATSI
ncbi:hypothetical protein BKA81DRAFT_10196 [Phyllosticta paracitricarpa]